MTTRFGAVIVAVSATVLAGCATTDVSKSGIDATVIDLSTSETVVLTVHGLSCPLCSNNLDGQLMRIKGVEGVSIDLDTGAVSIKLAPGHSVSAADLAKAVDNAGFTLKRIEPTVTVE